MTLITVDEYGTVQRGGLRPSAADLAAADSEELSRRVGLRWLRGDVLEVTAGPHVGVVELDCATVRVRPKLKGEELAVLRMIDYSAGLDALRDLKTPQVLGQGLDLRDLVCLLLTRETGGLLRHGLRRDYLRREEDLPTVRGRLLADRQVMRRFGRLDRLECRYDERSGDILDNRLCAAALQLAARTVTDPGVRRDARRLAADFAEVCSTRDFDVRAAAERLVYHRANEHYREAHRWALMLFGRAAFSDLYASHGPVTRAFMVDMNALFERFVTRLLRDAATGTGVDVLPQKTLTRAVVTADGKAYAPIKPDVQLVRGHGSSAWRRSVDAKYKLYADRKIQTSDLFQSFAYAHALSGSDGAGPPTAYVLYASDRDVPPESLRLHRHDGTAAAQVTCVAVNVPDVLGRLAADEPAPIVEELRRTLLHA
ncbi:McrC family protein [Actinomadura sediminis]|uniref:McrC family protein n=1 Tax=Actinomadura sediminis TaxID=1038904 RepID=A0ABW3EL51_9ACTN